MGGIVGHMNHPHDIFGVDEITAFYNDFFNNELTCYEKVDGVQLTIGFKYTDKLRVLYKRNKSEDLNEDIIHKFPTHHPEHNTFKTAMEVIRKAFANISREELQAWGLTDVFNFPKKYISLEVLFGEKPNTIRYSDNTNYIVFHNFLDNNFDIEPFNGYNANFFNTISKKLGDVSVNTKLVDTNLLEYYIKTNWKFKGRIEISLDNKKNLDTINFKELDSYKTMVKEGTKESIRTFNKNIGDLILRNITSELRDTKTPIVEDEQLIEGLVINYIGETLKITGNFYDINNDNWTNVYEERKLASVFNEFMFNDVFRYKATKITHKGLSNVNFDYEKFLHKKNPNFYNEHGYGFSFEELLGIKEYIQTFIKTNISNLSVAYLNRIQSFYQYLCDNERQGLKRADILEVFTEIFFYIKRG